MELHLFFLICLIIIPAIIAVFTADLLKSVIALLFCSIGLTLVFFDLAAPLAAVFELSVCAGLITVLFVLTISLTRPVTGEGQVVRQKLHYRKFLALPFLVILIAVLLYLSREQWLSAFPAGILQEKASVGQILWKTRGLDLIGQVVLLLVGVFGVVVLFKRGKTNE